MSRSRDVEPDDIVQLFGEGSVVRQLEAAPAMGRKAEIVPDLHRNVALKRHH